MATLARERWIRDFSLSVGTASNTASRNKSIVNGLRYHRRVYKLLAQHLLLNQIDQDLHVEPWLREVSSRRCLQPDAVLVDPSTSSALVIEVKLNWKDGRDEKLINEYLFAAQSAFGLRCVWPALITSNVAGLSHEPRIGLSQLLGCADWAPGDPTPVVLLP